MVCSLDHTKSDDFIPLILPRSIPCVVLIRLLEKSGMRSIKLSLFLLAVWLPLLAMSEEVYRTVDETGQVIFTDTAPPSGKPVEAIELLPGPTDKAMQNSETRNKALRSRLDTMQKERQQEEVNRASRVREAEKAVVTAESDLKVAKELQDDDWQMTVNGKRRIKAAYFERVKQAETALEDARKALRKVRSRY
jgi:hypothetical protein